MRLFSWLLRLSLPQALFTSSGFARQFSPATSLRLWRLSSTAHCPLNTLAIHSNHAGKYVRLPGFVPKENLSLHLTIFFEADQLFLHCTLPFINTLFSLYISSSLILSKLPNQLGYFSIILKKWADYSCLS